MKKACIILMGFVFLLSCNANPGESGTVNDGMKAVDTNGALPDTAMAPSPGIDSSKGDHRVDTEHRDSSETNR